MCEWQSWFISVYNHVTAETQAPRRRDNSTGPSRTHTHAHTRTHTYTRTSDTYIKTSKHIHWRNTVNPRPVTQIRFQPRSPNWQDSYRNGETSSNLQGQHRFRSFWMYILLLFSVPSLFLPSANNHKPFLSGLPTFAINYWKWNPSLALSKQILTSFFFPAADSQWKYSTGTSPSNGPIRFCNINMKLQMWINWGKKHL